MSLYKLIFFLFILIIVSCGKQKPVQTRLYTDDGMEVLNGHVKEIVSGDSTSKMREYYKYDFNGNCDIAASIEKSVNIISTEGKTDTSISVDKRKYLISRNSNGLITAIKLSGSVSGAGYLISNYSNRLGFDKYGHLAVNGDPRHSTGGIIYYKCDTAGRVVKSTWVHRGMSAEPEVYRYKYDNKHLLIEKTSYEGILLYKITFEYKQFDFNRNWIKKICTLHSYNPGGHHDSSTFIVTRKITYY